MKIICSYTIWCFFFFQAEDGIRDAQESRGLGDVYKRQVNSHSSGIAIVLWVIVGAEVLALISAYCKQSRAMSREMETPLLDGDGEPKSEAQLMDRYGAGAVVFTSQKSTYTLGGQ
eukprot:TRINITY_DN54547_c0_g1_i3.p1 TRINITY_DN54547_c0_g1~~TRINITY_DN54547_c0_g1_i3.p1  ORF type:complete len:116 (-),score=27.46 TRINITY_DN54547_c0_g1_i3:342-689(-)